MRDCPVRVLVIGGGFAGAFAARELRCRLPPHAEIELISERNYFVFQPLLPEVVAGIINVLDAVTPLRLMLKNIRVRMGEVRSIDFDSKTLELVQGSKRKPIQRPYDHLVIALGQRTNLEMLPGFAEHGFCVRNLNDAHHLRNQVLQCLEHADVTEDHSLKRRLLTFVVAGGGFSGVEVAGELSEMIERTLSAYPHISLSEVRTIIVHRGDRLLPELPEKLGRYAEKKLRQRGLDIRLDTGLTKATSTAVYTSDSSIRCQTLITTVGNAPTDLAEGLDVLKIRGRIVTDSRLRVPDRENVWALGDAALIPLSGEGEVFAPATAQFAVAEARHLAKNLAAAVKQRPESNFSCKPRGSMASIGRYRAVAEVFGVRISGLSAWLLWRGFYLSMLPGFATKVRVALNWLFDYFLPRSTVQTEVATPRGARRLCYSQGDVLFEPGQIVDGFYSVISGSLESRVPSPGGGEDFVRTLGPGDHWGERTLSEGRKTQGRLVAAEDSTVLVLSRDDFHLLVRAVPPLDDYLQSIPDKTYPEQLRRRVKNREG